MPGMDGFISFNGTLDGSIKGGGGGDVVDVKVRHSQSTDYESVVDLEKIALIDLISYVRRNELAQELQTQEYNFDLKLDLKQNNLIAGENITLENNVISAKASGVNYTTEEQNTGTKWIDGRDIFIKSFILENQITLTTTSWTNTDLILLNVDKFINSFGLSEDGTFQGPVVVDKSNDIIKLQSIRNPRSYIKYLTVQYTKEV